MSTPQETAQAIQRALEPYIRPRAEAARIRAILTANLDYCLADGPTAGPLALVGPNCTVKANPNVRGLQGEYLRAVSANVDAQRAYISVREKSSSGATSVAGVGSANSGRLEEHLTAIKLQKKRERLEVVIKYLDLLGQKPPASAGFLEPEEIFSGSRPLPGVPKEVVSGFALDRDVSTTDLKALVTRLEKAVLRSKLLLKKEEDLLDDVKSRFSVQPGTVHDGAKLAALSNTRNELINWIETELGKVSGEEEQESEEATSSSGPRGPADRGDMDEQLASVKQKYVRYLEARKSLIHLVSQRHQPPLKPPVPEPSTSATTRQMQLPTTYLISLYLERLLQVAREQKASITEKSHLHAIISRQTRDSCQALDHLAEESQLLPTYGVPGTSQKKAPIGSGLSAPEKDLAYSRIKGWVSAADSAKLATLENVTEKIEEGQLALEASTRALDEIDHLLGRVNLEGNDVAPDAADDDIWLEEGQSKTARPSPRKHARGKSEDHKSAGGIWSILDGNLGLINSDESPV
ncbi:hypothetical protein NKR23_g7439 [Pleurostoma richardsiae]|uniref:Uncharacterized protein n=1 Tax=Pleurostoma richardsiae TaxID=41990 RepID=A0AA38R8H0_9PEZI|nr:hypothetical protein NKR23_g7439 [Pleurostoma richardsiae]